MVCSKAGNSFSDIIAILDPNSASLMSVVQNIEIKCLMKDHHAYKYQLLLPNLAKRVVESQFNLAATNSVCEQFELE